MKKILFIAEYPNEQNIKDGMIQRIKAIDSEFRDVRRTYLHFDFKKYCFPKFENRINTRVIRLNFFTGIPIAIYYLISYKNIYIHSVYNCEKIFWFFLLKSKLITIDVHGSVPEELEYYGKPRKSKWLQKVEKRFFSHAQKIICVSNQMKNFYLSKYPNINPQVLIKPIVPTNVVHAICNADVEKLKKELNISNDKTVFIYSGNLQKWQNFELTLDTIVKNDRPNYHYIFLSKECDRVAALVKNTPIPSQRLTIRSVSPELLSNYYALANYGFILRDNHILNKVAAPTKLLEYLYFGITPIVKYEDIGDASLMNYEHISYDNVGEYLQPVKSKKNISIAREIIDVSINNSIVEFVQSSINNL